MSRRNRRKIQRSGNQPCEICGLETPLQEHHIRGRDIENANKQFNLVALCPTCHDRVHCGLIIIEGWFMTTSGNKLIYHQKGENSITGNKISPPKYSP